MSLKTQMSYLLRQQRQAGKHAQNAHHGATNADYTHIYSDNSLDRHVKAAASFAKWGKEHGVTHTTDINHEKLGEYCMDMQAQGYSAWTIKAGITAVNHVMVQTGHWTHADVFKATTWNKQNPDRHMQLKAKNKGEIMNNRRQTAEEWRKENATLYSNNRRLIDTARAFGLRKSELCHTDKNKPAIVKNSFFECKGRLYCFVPYGKGGRPRFATCRKDLEPEMRRMYDVLPVKHIPTTMTDTKRFRDVFVHKNEANYRKNEFVFSGKVSGRLRFHVQRREYACERLSEEFSRWGRYNNTQVTVNGVDGNETAFRIVANDLGHGRIDVIGNYVEEGDFE